MGTYQLASDSQTQAATRPGVALARPIAAPETVEDVGQVFGRDATAGICYADLHAILNWACFQRDRTARRGVADGVGDQITQHLVEAVSVGLGFQILPSVF